MHHSTIKSFILAAIMAAATVAPTADGDAFAAATASAPCPSGQIKACCSVSPDLFGNPPPDPRGLQCDPYSAGRSRPRSWFKGWADHAVDHSCKGKFQALACCPTNNVVSRIDKSPYYKLDDADEEGCIQNDIPATAQCETISS